MEGRSLHRKQSGEGKTVSPFRRLAVQQRKVSGQTSPAVDSNRNLGLRSGAKEFRIETRRAGGRRSIITAYGFTDAMICASGLRYF